MFGKKPMTAAENKTAIPMDNIINTILEKTFRRIGNDGYDRSEVDDFLDAICDVVEKLEAEHQSTRQQLNDAMASKQDLERKLQNALASLEEAKAAKSEATIVAKPAAAPVVPVAAPVAAPAQDNTDDVKEILLMAQRMKSEVIANAQQKADQIVAEAKQNAEAQLGDLNAQRTVLEEQVKKLQTTAADYRSKITALIDLTREAIEASDL